MAETDIGSTEYSDLTNAMTSYSVESETTDGSLGTSEFRWQMPDWPQNLGYYKKIPELQVAVDTEATWVVGGGFEADEQTEMLLGAIKGNGKDSFNSILGNLVRTATIGGDSYAEVIHNDDDIIVNLKPLDPSSIVIVQNAQGRIVRYEQVNKHKETTKKFDPEEIFHLSRRRIADEIHGISVIPAVEWIILARNEAMSDWKTVLHRNVAPLQIHKLDTDDTAEVDAYKVKADKARADGENLYIPKGTVEVEVVQSQLNQAASPLAWIDRLADYFFQAVNTPQIVIGNAKEFTDASGKIVYLSYEQSVKGKQLYIEEQVLNQLNIEISLTFPASMQNEMITSMDKDQRLQASSPNDVTAELEGPT